MEYYEKPSIVQSNTESSMGDLDTALMSVASHANGPSLVHSDLDCDRIAEVCDDSCQDEALLAFAGVGELFELLCRPLSWTFCDMRMQQESNDGDLTCYLGGQYVPGAAPMQGKLLWDESSKLDLVNLPERELAGELACLVNAANGPWKVPPAPIGEGEKTRRAK
eukprot:7907954-Pyramimonas_sp.AAC.1